MPWYSWVAKTEGVNMSKRMSWQKAIVDATKNGLAEGPGKIKTTICPFKADYLCRAGRALSNLHLPTLPIIEIKIQSIEALTLSKVRYWHKLFNKMPENLWLEKIVEKEIEKLPHQGVLQSTK